MIQKWSISEDRQTYTFTINDNFFWTDGKRVQASDIQLHIPSARITAQQNTVKIVLDNPYSPLLTALSKPIFRNQTIGLGPDQITKITFSQGFVKKIYLKSNKVYVFYPNQEDLINGFKLGEINKIESVYDIQNLTNFANTKIIPKSSSNQIYLAVFLNTRKLTSKSLRQALAYATPKTIDKKDRCLGPISPTSWAYNPSIKEYPLNPKHARELFKDNQISSISLTVASHDLVPIAENIRKNWQEALGISVDLITKQETLDISNFQAVLSTAPIPTDPDQYLFWHSTQKTNITGINNPKIDKLLEDGRDVIDQQQRKKIYYEFQKVLLEESPAIFISYPITYSVTRTN